MSNCKISISTRYFTIDSYISDKSQLIAKEQNFSISDIDIREKLVLESKIIEDLLTKHSSVDYTAYKKIKEYSKRRPIIEKAIRQKEFFIQDIIVKEFNAERTESKNVFLIDSDNLLAFINRFYNEGFINWQKISQTETLLWTEKIIDAGKFVWDWYELQINPSLIDYFNNFKVIKKYQNFLNWNIVSSDSRLNWTTEYIRQFNSKINFTRIKDQRLKHNKAIKNVQKCFVNNGDPCGLSMNPNLDFLTIIENEELWDWQCLSSNPAILKNDNFLEDYLDKIDLYGLCHNKGLKIEHLRFLRDIYTHSGKPLYFSSIHYNSKNITWSFNWKSAFENANIDWSLSDVDEFFLILDETSITGENNWQGISKNISNKRVIIKHSSKLNFLSICLNNPEIVWDVDLTSLLIESNLPLKTDKFSKALPDVLEKINITEEAILTYAEFWKKSYYWSYWHRNSDGTELITFDLPLWYCFKKNKFVNWTEKLSILYEND